MRGYIKSYIERIDSLINENMINNDLINEHIYKINFFQHERLIHLLVTLFYSFIFIIFLALITLSYLFIPIAVILLVFVILYVYHYFYLENCVQYHYKQYDMLKEKNK